MAENIAQQLERQVGFVVYEACCQSAMRLGALGVRISAGRLGGAEIAELNGIVRVSRYACVPKLIT